MAYIVNDDIIIMSRSGRIAKKLTCMLNKDIKKQAIVEKKKAIQDKIEEAAKKKQELDAKTQKTNDIVKESEAAKAYFGLK